MFVLPKSKKKRSSRLQIDIKGAKEGVLLLPHNHYRMVLQVSPVNFEVKSEVEQDAMIDTYESFLNSLSTPLQILVRIREIDMDDYLANLNERLEHEKTLIYKQQLANYNEFITGLVTVNKILTRHFYVIIPFNGNRGTDFDVVCEQLAQTVDLVEKGLGRLGMQCRQLDSPEILTLFYSFYNEEQSKIQPLTEQTLALLHSGYVQKETKA